jgi:hypothetical protein
MLTAAIFDEALPKRLHVEARISVCALTRDSMFRNVQLHFIG